MKVLIINTSDLIGGAARASYRLHQALLSEGIDSQILVQNKISDDYHVIGAESKGEKVMYKIRPFLDSIPLKFYKKRTQSWFSSSLLPFSNIVDKINAINPDIVHLHWINEGMMTIEDIAKIKAPIVWSLHDMWPFTGGCHYDEECGRYSDNCGKCKVLGSVKENDLSKKIFNKKRTVFLKKKNMTIVGLSKWLTGCAQKSSLFQNKRVINLPNPINTEVFKPVDKQVARELLNLPLNKKLILFTAVGATSDPRKGFKEVKEAFSNLDTEDIEFIVIGSSKPKDDNSMKYHTYYMGYIHDDISLRLLYSAADVMVVPSLQENLSNVIMEAMSCATPVVAFNIGGNSDMVVHKQTGYLAQPLDSMDLARGIIWVIDSLATSVLSANARQKVIGEFDQTVVAQQYISLYSECLSQR